VIIKAIIGAGFKGCVEYVLQKQGAKLLCVHGVRAEMMHMIRDFITISKLRPTLSKAVWHAPISFAFTDSINDDLMVQIAKDYVEHIGLKANQYMVARHSDTEHQHLHIVSNRVGFDGSVVSDKFCKNRSARVSDILEAKYGLTIAREARKNKKTLAPIDSSKLKGKAKIKREVKEFIRDEVESHLKSGIKSIESLKARLSLKNIEMRIQYNSKQTVVGVSFRAK
jgi:hypothetical protein